MTNPDISARVTAMRRFNRFYTHRIGLLKDGLFDTGFSLTEARVLHELDQTPAPTATAIAATLGLDAGYLSRILRGFAKAGLITRKISPRDRRQTLIALSAKGRAALMTLDRASQQLIAAMLEPLPDSRQRRVIEAMRTIETALDPQGAPTPVVTIRPHRIGDLGWVMSSHATRYGEEYGWRGNFETLIAEIIVQVLREFDPARERGWIAEMDGEPVGSIFLVNAGEETARLRLLMIEPHARGLGLGRRLLDECIRFAREARYRRITLFTHSVLTVARALYLSAGFRLVREEPYRSFGHDLIGETWDLDFEA